MRRQQLARDARYFGCSDQCSGLRVRQRKSIWLKVSQPFRSLKYDFLEVSLRYVGS